MPSMVKVSPSGNTASHRSDAFFARQNLSARYYAQNQNFRYKRQFFPKSDSWRWLPKPPTEFDAANSLANLSQREQVWEIAPLSITAQKLFSPRQIAQTGC
jgi:hypothetical protein